MKKTIQMSNVPIARPSQKRCLSVRPGARSSVMMKRTLAGSSLCGSMRRRIAMTAAGSPPVTTRCRIDSGRKTRSVAARTSGMMPPTIKLMATRKPEAWRRQGSPERRSQREAAKHDNSHPRSHAIGEIFGCQRYGVRHAAAQPHISEEPQDAQRTDRMSAGGSQRENTERPQGCRPEPISARANPPAVQLQGSR